MGRTAAGLLAAAIVTALIALGAGPALGAVAPYGANDAGGFRNVLPAGEAGTDNAAQLAQFQSTGQRPPHWDDQLPLYTDLLYASPTLTHNQIASYYKDATFGVKNADVASTESPRADVTIVRDKAYGVPHIYGTTRAGVEFGAGYAGAEDRLFLMDILRHTGRAQLSSFVGGAAGNRAMDQTQWTIAPYTEADLQKQVDNATTLYGAAGQQVVNDVNNFVAGINAYIDAALLDPNKMPAEYAAFGKTPQHWTPTDVIAEASLIGGIFGKGGGNEVRSALTLQAFENKFGPTEGRNAWVDFRSKNDPEAPTTVSQTFNYEQTSPFATKGLALPDPGSVTFPPVSSGVQSTTSSSSSSTSAAPKIPNDGSVGSQLLRNFFSERGHASNWLLIPPRNSTTGHSLGVLGPQVGYYVPEILMEQDMHGPGFDARGATFPGVNLYVQLGHGRDYAWSATTATSDNVDTFAEVLCQDDFHYRYKGQCLAMEKLERTNSWTPTAGDQTPAGSETLTVYRTVHGIVYARGMVGGKKVAYASARTTYFHEADSALGFVALNDPAKVHDPASFQSAASKINFAFNWAYLDANNISYFLSGAYPQRATDTSPDFPVLGTGAYDWQGFDPTLYTMNTVPFAGHPKATNPEYLISWNNKQAPGWSAADDKYSFGPVYRSQMLEARVKSALANGKISLEQLVQAMEEPASEDIRSIALWPILRKALGNPSDPDLKTAITRLQNWYNNSGHRRDLNKDGVYDADRSVTLMDAWWPKLLDAAFHSALGDQTFNALQGMVEFGGPYPGGSPAAPSFSDGWYGFVSKDLRDIFSPTSVNGPWSRKYCGNGSVTACRTALQASLKSAFSVTKQELYGVGECEDNAQASCHDMNRFTIASAIGVPDFPFQNRPTFQQTVEPTRTLPR
jgi:acyl-homoserine lactone acylase PvdQ